MDGPVRCRTAPDRDALLARQLGRMGSGRRESPGPERVVAGIPFCQAGKMADRSAEVRRMRIALLAGGDGWHVRDLQRAAVQLGHEAVAVDFRRVTRRRRAPAASPLAGFDAVIVRTMPPGSLEQVVFRMDVLHRLQARGVPRPQPAAAAGNLRRQVPGHAPGSRPPGCAVPPTVVCQHADAALEAFTPLGGDVVVKPLFGSEGRGMVRVTDPELAWRTFRTLERTQSVLYLQQFVRHPGWDLRVFVLGGRVLAAMRRHATRRLADQRRPGRQRPSRSVRAPPRRTAGPARRPRPSARRSAGVDLLPGPDGEWYVLEVNAVPGWRALAPVDGRRRGGRRSLRFLTERVSGSR